jgi:hypothetical protein
MKQFAIFDLCNETIIKNIDNLYNGLSIEHYKNDENYYIPTYTFNYYLIADIFKYKHSLQWISKSFGFLTEDMIVDYVEIFSHNILFQKYKEQLYLYSISVHHHNQLSCKDVHHK